MNNYIYYYFYINKMLINIITINYLNISMIHDIDTICNHIAKHFIHYTILVDLSYYYFRKKI